MDRRSFLRTSIQASGAMTAAMAAPQVLAAPQSLILPNADLHSAADKSLHLYNIHTGETLKSTFYAEGQLIEDSLLEIDRFLRDHRSGDATLISRNLLQDIYQLQAQFQPKQAIEIISAYRSPKTNEYLQSLGRKVAKRSLHMQGKAIDIRIPGTQLKHVRKAALAMKSVGVGYYPRSGFVHLDVGRVRQWAGK